MPHRSDEYARFTAYGHQLIAVHHRLLDQLDDLRDGIVADREFGAHCLALCSAVTRHHTGEDTTVFPELAARHPELRSFLDDLERDHQVIAGILTRLTTLAAELGAAPPHAAGDGARDAVAFPAELGVAPPHAAGDGARDAVAFPAELGVAPPHAAGDGARDAVRMELDGLAAVLETHFIGEEKRLVAVLDALDPSVGLTGLDESVG